jgi:hypothetical protein
MVLSSKLRLVGLVLWQPNWIYGICGGWLSGSGGTAGKVGGAQTLPDVIGAHDEAHTPFLDE